MERPAAFMASAAPRTTSKAPAVIASRVPVAASARRNGFKKIAAREHDRGNGAGADQGRGRGLGETAAIIGLERREQGQQRQERHHRHVLEQEHCESALAVSILQLSALFEDLQRDRGGRHGERKAGHGRAAPVEPEGRDRQRAEGERGEKKLSRAKAEYIAPQGEAAARFSARGR